MPKQKPFPKIWKIIKYHKKYVTVMTKTYLYQKKNRMRQCWTIEN